MSKYASSKIENFIVPIFLASFAFIVSYFSNQQRIELRIFYLSIASFLFSLILIYWRTCIITLTDNNFTVKYPFKIPFKRNFNFKLTDIVLITFTDPLDLKASYPKLEIQYKEDNAIKILLLEHDIKYRKVQLLINELRERGIKVETKSVKLK